MKFVVERRVKGRIDFSLEVDDLLTATVPVGISDLEVHVTVRSVSNLGEFLMAAARHTDTTPEHLRSEMEKRLLRILEERLLEIQSRVFTISLQERRPADHRMSGEE